MGNLHFFVLIIHALSFMSIVESFSIIKKVDYMTGFLNTYLLSLLIFDFGFSSFQGMLRNSICGMYPNQTPIMPNKVGSSPRSLSKMKLTSILRYTDQDRGKMRFFGQGCKVITARDFRMGSRIALELADAASQKTERTSNCFPSCQMKRTPKSSTSLPGPNSILVEKYDLADLEWTDDILECPIYHPSETEFEDPFTYLQSIAPEASNYGICKIVSPFKATIPAKDVLRHYKFSTLVQPLQLAGRVGKDMVKFTEQKRKYTLATFRKKANKGNARRLPHYRELSPSDVEKNFWLEMSRGKRTVEYAVNVEGSAFSCHAIDQLGKSKWNLKALPKLPASVLRLIKDEIPGITYPMLYIGMLYSTFAWHVEDHYLNSINYHHTGAPKTWYGVPGDEAILLEKVTKNHVYSSDVISADGDDGVFKALAKKTTMFSPIILMKNGVDVYKTVQKPGEFVITFPRAYHAGFSHGFNCGEAVNFAVGDWFPFGAAATKRYAFLSMRGIIPHEELLCREAVLLFKSSKSEGFDCATVDLVSNDSTKNSFIQHMHWFNDALQRLKNRTRRLPKSHGSVICCLCQCSSYLAFIECSGCHSPTCLFHALVSKYNANASFFFFPLHLFLPFMCRLIQKLSHYNVNVERNALFVLEKTLTTSEMRLRSLRVKEDCSRIIKKWNVPLLLVRQVILNLRIRTPQFQGRDDQVVATTYAKEAAVVPGIDEKNIELNEEKTSETGCNKFFGLAYSRRSKRARKSCIGEWNLCSPELCSDFHRKFIRFN
ncbi:lysine-specific demethylase JMJ706-like [Tripterygium wilfordii]|uniref:lysine-specific demethylase JMJ706-like n=1 Tax=Tripterygium wilfordii TaxID=458696 RepID=UPI0018F7EA30|nr:lysine-specific demethylase JMJ706-like [Tripterygium wilfordii]